MFICSFSKFHPSKYLNTLYTEAINYLSKLPSHITANNNGDQLDAEFLVDLCKTLQDFIQIRQSQIMM